MSRGRSHEDGFTIVELLVALLIFGMIAAAGVALLSFSVRAQDLADERLDDVAALRRASALLTGDLSQATPRIARDEAGAVQPAFVGGTGSGGEIALAFVRRGWDNPEGTARPSLQKVEYRLVGDRLERVAYRFVDGAEPMTPVTLLEGVEALTLCYRDDEGQWRERWDPTRITDLPRAIEMVVDTNSAPPVRELFLVGVAL